jgi:hypothetical protein
MHATFHGTNSKDDNGDKESNYLYYNRKEIKRHLVQTINLMQRRRWVSFKMGDLFQSPPSSAVSTFIMKMAVF